jgi:hypothetical protein
MSAPTESRDEAHANAQPTEPFDLQFLTFTNFNQTIDSETKKKVRSHVQSRLQEERRSAKEKAKERKLKRLVRDSSSLSNMDAGLSQALHSTASGQAVIPHPRGLGAGGSDPFKRYPINMDVRMHELYDHGEIYFPGELMKAFTNVFLEVHGGHCPMFETLSKIGFYKTIEDDAALRQVLCTSSMHQTRLRNVEENTEAIILSHEALRSINKRIADPALATSDGVLFAILAFAAHAVSNLSYLMREMLEV